MPRGLRRHLRAFSGCKPQKPRSDWLTFTKKRSFLPERCTTKSRLDRPSISRPTVQPRPERMLVQGHPEPFQRFFGSWSGIHLSAHSRDVAVKAS